MTDKTLKHFFEVYKPKAPDEQKFVDKHVTIKHKDRNGNGDDVFNATNIKTIDRKKENHGYNSGEDEKVYESLETERVKHPVGQRPKGAGWVLKSAGEQTGKDHSVWERKFKKVAEEVEELDESWDPAYTGAGKKHHTIRALDYKKKAANHLAIANGRAVKDSPQYHSDMAKHHSAMAEHIKSSFIAGSSRAGSMANAKQEYKEHKAKAKEFSNKSSMSEEVEDLEELSHATLRRYRMKAKSIGDNEKGDIGYRSKGRDLAARKTHGGQWGIPKAKVMAKEEAEQVDEIAPLIAAGAELAAGAAGRALATRAATSLGASAAERMVAGQAGKFAGKALASKAASSLTSKSSGGKDVKEEVEQLEEGTMKLSKVHIVHHHDHPAAKEFAKHYTEGMKGEHREGGPSEKDEAASNRFHERYSGMTTRHGFAGSGTTIYHDHKTGAKWKVDRHPNGKTFYGTDHIISHHIPSVNESVEEEILSTEAEDRVIRSLVAYYEELGEEALINDIVDIAEQMLDELSTKTLDSYRSKARKEIIDADANDDTDTYNKRTKGYTKASKNIRKNFVKGVDEEVEQIDELSTATLQSYRKKARAQGNAIVDKMKVGGGDWSKDQKDTKTLRKRASGAQMSGKTLRKRGESLKTEEVEQIDELSKATLGSYVKKAKTQMSRSDTVAGRLAGERMKGGKPSAQERKHSDRANKRYFGIDKAVDRLTKEEVENIDELSKSTLGSYVTKAARSAGSNIAGAVASGMANGNKDDQRSMGRNYAKRLKGIDTAAKKLTKEDVINRAVEKYSPSEEERLSLDEQLVARIEDMKESHIHLILNLFEQLDESNQRNLLDMIDQGRVNEVLDFAISAVRGE